MSSDRKDPGSRQEPSDAPQANSDWVQPPDYVPAVDEDDIPSPLAQQASSRSYPGLVSNQPQYQQYPQQQQNYPQQQAFIQDEADLATAQPEEVAEPELALTPRELLKNFSQYLALFILPLLFAGLTYLFVLPRVAAGEAVLPAIGFWPIVVIILAVMIAQGVVVYYAGSDNGLWILGTLGGLCLFLLIACFAVYGLFAGILLLVAILVVVVYYARRSLHPVPEGVVDIVYAGEKYARTLYAGFNILLPWEKVHAQLSVEEVQWLSPTQVVQLSRDEDVSLRAVISYQLLPEDAYLAVSQVRSWEESLRTLCQTILQEVAVTFTPDDFLVWDQQALQSQNQSGDDNFASGFARRNAINKHVQQLMSDKVALWGVQVNWVSIRDIELIPHGSSTHLPAQTVVVAEPDTASSAASAAAVHTPKEQTEPMLVRMKRGVAAAAAPQVAPGAPTPVATPTSAPAANRGSANSGGKAANQEVLINAYKAVQDGRITDPETIRRIASEFDGIARDPVASQHVSFDAAQAARNLSEQANKYDERYLNEQYHEDTHPDWLPRRAGEENLTAGG